MSKVRIQINPNRTAGALGKGITRQKEANEILRNCKEEIKRNTKDALADIDTKIEELAEKSEKNIVSLKSEAKKEVNALSKKLAPEIVKALIP